ncbi:MAG TPA: PDZ domain-containing protein [Bacteroidota bacterium]|nr:PDZ domain-containing protein [Bacteroidota bacterium]
MKGRIIAAAVLISLLPSGHPPAGQNRGGDNQEKGTDTRGWLGVAIQDVTPRLAREKGLPVKSGTLVNDVSAESPADSAGIQEDDVIVDFNGRSIEESDDLLSAVRAASPGERASVTLYRGQEKKSLQVTVGKAPRRSYSYSFHGPGMGRIHPFPPMPRMPRIRMFGAESVLGLTLRDLKGQMGEYFEAPNGRGVLVEEVERKSEGERGGFKAGDVIIRAGTSDVQTTEDVTDALSGLKKGDKIEFAVVRKGGRIKLTVESEGPGSERWDGFRSFQFNTEAPPGFDRNSFRREMERLKEELRGLGREIKAGMLELEKKLKSVTL